MQYTKAITKKIKDEIFIWDPTAYGNKGYWYVLGTSGAFGRPASKAEAKKLGKPTPEVTQPKSPKVLEEAPAAPQPKQNNKNLSYLTLFTGTLSGAFLNVLIKSILC